MQASDLSRQPGLPWAILSVAPIIPPDLPVGLLPRPSPNCDVSLITAATTRHETRTWHTLRAEAASENRKQARLSIPEGTVSDALENDSQLLPLWADLCFNLETILLWCVEMAKVKFSALWGNRLSNNHLLLCQTKTISAKGEEGCIFSFIHSPDRYEVTDYFGRWWEI